MLPDVLPACVGGAPDCGGIVSYNYCAGEPVSHVEEGCPMVIRDVLSPLNARNLARSHVYAAFAVLRMGMDLLWEEGAAVTCLTAHGGLFKTPMVSQQIMADALNLPVIVRATAGEGGAWGGSFACLLCKKENPVTDIGRISGGQGICRSIRSQPLLSGGGRGIRI